MKFVKGFLGTERGVLAGSGHLRKAAAEIEHVVELLIISRARAKRVLGWHYIAMNTVEATGNL